MPVGTIYGARKKPPKWVAFTLQCFVTRQDPSAGPQSDGRPVMSPSLVRYQPVISLVSAWYQTVNTWYQSIRA